MSMRRASSSFKKGDIMSGKTLLSLGKGEKAKIKKLNNEKSMRNRLFDLGLTPGSETEFLFCAPSGSPRAFLIRGAVIALRKKDCMKIEIFDD